MVVSAFQIPRVMMPAHAIDLTLAGNVRLLLLSQCPFLGLLPNPHLMWKTAKPLVSHNTSFQAVLK